MQPVFCNSNDKDYQNRLNALLKEVFFDFRFWYDLNLWDDRYESYAIEDHDKIVSNICLFKTRVLYRNQPYDAISLGAVATKPEYRGQGLLRRLMEQIDRKYAGIPMYLSANDTVLDFYPRFGFRRFTEYLPLCRQDIDHLAVPHRLSCDDPRVRHYICGRVNFSPIFDCLNTEPVNLFHLYSGYLNDCLYELQDINTLIVAQQTAATLKLFGVFSLQAITWRDLADRLPFSGIKRLEFGFLPYWPDLHYDLQADDSNLWFVKNIPCSMDAIKYPELSAT